MANLGSEGPGHSSVASPQRAAGLRLWELLLSVAVFSVGAGFIAFAHEAYRPGALRWGDWLHFAPSLFSLAIAPWGLTDWMLGAQHRFEPMGLIGLRMSLCAAVACFVWMGARESMVLNPLLILFSIAAYLGGSVLGATFSFAALVEPESRRGFWDFVPLLACGSQGLVVLVFI